jgi:5-methylcytosine-specific restriction endonuclease McrA
MREVQRSPEPEFFDDLRAKYQEWEDLDRTEQGRRNRRKIRGALAQRDFGYICAYCQQSCSPPSRNVDNDGNDRKCRPLMPGRLTNEETIDHFRPRSSFRFSHLWLHWENLVYACYRCNQSKCDQWPEPGDKTNQYFSVVYLSYTPVSKYVNPNSGPGQRPAQDFFDFRIDSGTRKISPDMVPAASVDQGGSLSTLEQSIALRTIKDFDLNDEKSGLGYNDKRHLWKRRLRQVDLLEERLKLIDDFDAKVKMMLKFMLPGKPFSAFIYAYLVNRFPNLRILLEPESTEGIGCSRRKGR